MKEPKYRITLTAPQIHYINQLIDLPSAIHDPVITAQLKAYLKLMITKLELGMVSISHTTLEKKSLEDQLGLNDAAERRLHSYLKWQANPALCTPSQIEDAKLYRYENDMMTAAEEADYEKEFGL